MKEAQIFIQCLAIGGAQSSQITLLSAATMRLVLVEEAAIVLREPVALGIKVFCVQTAKLAIRGQAPLTNAQNVPNSQKMLQSFSFFF